MERALTFAGYEVNHDWGDGGHNGKHATEIFPDAMRWLWKDWPAAGQGRRSARRSCRRSCIPGEDWKLVGEGYKFTEGPAANAKGEVFFNDVRDSKTYKVGLDGKVERVPRRLEAGRRPGVRPRRPALRRRRRRGADRRLRRRRQADGDRRRLPRQRPRRAPRRQHLRHRPGSDAATTEQGLVHQPEGREEGRRHRAEVRQRRDALARPVAAVRRRQPQHWVYSYQIQPDGSLAHKQKYYHLHVPDTADDSGADGMRVDRDGRLYVATRMGIQVCDQAGRVNCIIPTPNGKVSNLCFGGENFDTLYATCGDRVYSRKVKVKGANAFAAADQAGGAATVIDSSAKLRQSSE